MTNPFENRSPSLNGPATDLMPVIPSNGDDLPAVALALYVETGGSLRVTTVGGAERSVSVADFSILPVGVRRVHASGTSASGIHAFLLA